LFFGGPTEQAKTEKLRDGRSQNPILQDISAQNASQPRQLITVDGVTLTVGGSFLPASTAYTSPSPGNMIQVATAAVWRPFREMTITAVPFGVKAGVENLPISRRGAAGGYAEALTRNRSRQGRVLREAPVANIFGQQVAGSVSIAKLNIDGPVATPVLIVEWVVEAGERLWLVRASQEQPLASPGSEDSTNALALLADLSVSSDSVYAPSTILEAGDAPHPSSVDIAPNAAEGDIPPVAEDLAAPSWWNGHDCDSSHYFAVSGQSSFRLGAVYLGMPACGPRPLAGGTDVAVTWGGGVTQLEWECAELSKRYLYLSYGIAPYQANGSQVVWNYSGSALEKISNPTSGKAPQPGDVLSYGSTTTAGHTSVVMTSSVNGSGNGSITVIEENNSAGGASTLSVNNWTVNGNAGSVSGWLHNACTNGTATLRNRDGGPPIHPPGSVLKVASPDTVYLIDSDNRKRPITSSGVLAQLYNQSTDARTGTNFSNWVITVGQDELDLYEQGGNLSGAMSGNGQPFPDGKLIGYNGEVSIVTGGGRRRPFAASGTFTGLGFSFCQVVNVSQAEYNSYPAGPPVDAMPLLTSSLNLSPGGPYTTGQSITGSFTVKNVGYQSITFSNLGGGGRLDGTTVYDMSFDQTTLAAGSSHTYNSQPRQLSSSGTYNFFAAYQETNGHWALSVPAVAGVVRSRQFSVTTAVQNYTVTASASPAAGGAVSGGGTFASGSSVTVTASANGGYTFANWTENGSAVSSSSGYTFTLSSNRTLVANFTAVSVLDSPTLAAPGSTTAPGSSTATLTPTFQWQSVAGADGYGLYVSRFNGSTYDLVFDSETDVGHPLTGTTFVLPGGRLQDGGQYRWNMSTHNSAGYGTPNASRYYFYVSLPAQDYTITLSASPSGGGTASGGGTFGAGSSRTVTATANSGYTFSNWTEGGTVVSTSAGYTFTLNGNRTLVANFTADPVNYTITVSASPAVGGTVGGSGTFAAGSSRTVTATANSGYSFVSWTEGGGVVSTSAGYTFTLNSNRTLVANFTAAPPNSGGLQYYPLAHPVRLLDTRAGQAACYTPGVPLNANATRAQQAAGTCEGLSIPAAARAVVGNAAVINNLAGSGSGVVTLYPGGVARPVAANVNYTPGQVVSNAFTVGLGSDGAFNIYSYTKLDFVVDVTGYYAPPGAGGLYYHPLPKPVRLLDTRIGQSACDAPGAPIAGGSSRNESARTTCGGVSIPNDAKAVSGNAAVVNTQAGAGSGVVTLYPGGVARPVAANVNYAPGQVVSNAFTVGLGSEGTFNIYAYTTLDVVVDVSGYYSAGAAADANGMPGLLYYPLASPMRLLDTRAGQAACYTPGAPLAAGGVRAQNARLTCGSLTVPAGASAVVGNAAVINNLAGSGSGVVTLYPGGVARPVAANVNYAPGQVVSNAFTVGLGSDGAFNIYSYTKLDFVADISGYFAP
jgi:hypothetical protein